MDVLREADRLFGLGLAYETAAIGFSSLKTASTTITDGVVEQAKSFGCSGWKQGCRFAVWKTIAGKAIGVRTAQSLLKRGHTPLLKGFRSKAGKP